MREMADAQKHAVLVVDDDALVRGVLRRILSAKGYQVLEAATLGLAVTAIEKMPVELVFLDIYLPDGSGLDAMERMSKIRPGLKIALISADTSQFDSPQAKGDQVIECIRKPLSPERIERVLHSGFGGS